MYFPVRCQKMAGLVLIITLVNGLQKQLGHLTFGEYLLMKMILRYECCFSYSEYWFSWRGMIQVIMKIWWMFAEYLVKDPVGKNKQFYLCGFHRIEWNIVGYIYNIHEIYCNQPTLWHLGVSQQRDDQPWWMAAESLVNDVIYISAWWVHRATDGINQCKSWSWIHTKWLIWFMW